MSAVFSRGGLDTERAPARREILRRVRWLMVASLIGAVLLGASIGWLIVEAGFTLAVVVLGLIAIVAVIAGARRATVRVEQVFQRQDRLLRAAVHELHSPLGWVQVAVDEGLSGTLTEAEALADARTAVEELRELISDLVEAAQTISGAEVLADDRVDLEDIAIAVASRGVDSSAEVVVDAEPLVTRGSSALLRRAVSNLVRNAAAHGYGGREGTITIGVHDRGITVSDEGVGVGDAQLVELRRDVPLGISVEPGRVSLGLALVGWVAAVHGGSVELEHNRPRGFAATILVPTVGEGAA